jgi:hypothetical protein
MALRTDWQERPKMSKVVHEYALTVGGRGYAARVRGDVDSSGMWHAWIEFLPQDGGPALQTGRETTQSNYEQLEYWASGLSSSYLEGALDRARRTESATPVPPPPLSDPLFDPARIRDPHPEAAVVRLEVETLDPTLPLRVMAAPDLFEGRARRIPGGGILVYDGVTAPPGKPSRHAFLVQYGSTNAAAVLANRLWSELHGQGAAVYIEGVRVDIDNHEITERLKALLHVPRV